MARNVIIYISKTISSPRDKLAPSFLTTFPAENRNNIYEILYDRDEPVLLHNKAAYRRYVDWADNIIPNSLTDEGNDPIVKEPRNLHDEFDHGLTGNVSLLHSCRQLYHETAGVLYGSNTFLFSQVPLRHLNLGFKYSPTKPTATWISSIGSQISLVHCIEIDAGSLILEEDGNGPAMVDETDILPLIRLLWSYHGLLGKVKYVHTGRAW